MRLLGEVFQETFGVSPESIEAALAIQREKGGRIGEILIQMRKVTESDLLSARSSLTANRLLLAGTLKSYRVSLANLWKAEGALVKRVLDR